MLYWLLHDRTGWIILGLIVCNGVLVVATLILDWRQRREDRAQARARALERLRAPVASYPIRGRHGNAPSRLAVRMRAGYLGRMGGAR